MAKRKSVTFPSEIKKIGNGYFIPVAKAIIEKMQLDEGEDVDVTVSIPEMVE